MTAEATDTDYQQVIATELEEYQSFRVHGYRAVNVLLLAWDDSDIGGHIMAEMTDLRSMFTDDFRYAVWLYKIPAQNPGVSLNSRIAQFIELCGEERNLIIVYYSGHGGPKANTKSPCTWAANNEGGPTLDWSEIQPQVTCLASCDSVIFLDCCFAGQAARSRGSNSSELLAASDKDNWTPIGAGKRPSFTKALIHEMKGMLYAEDIVTLPALQKRLVQAKSGLLRQPLYVSLSGDSSAGTIKLRRLGEAIAASETQKSPAVPGSIYFRLSLFDAPDPTTTLRIVRWLTKDSPTTVRNIQLVGKTLSDAENATHLGNSLINDHRSEYAAASALSEEGQREIRVLIERLKQSLSSPSAVQASAPEVIGNVQKASSNLLTFVTDSLTAMDRHQLETLKSGHVSGLEDLRKRIVMRLMLMGEDGSEDKIRVDFADQSQPDQRLRLGTNGDDHVLVEYIYYDETDRDAPARTSQQVKRLSALLIEEKSRAFRCLPGLGFLYEMLHGSRFGFVYRLPTELVGRRYSLLSHLIKQVKNVPLEQRAQLACSICDALLHLHSIGWYHKNIKTANILIFDASSDGTGLASRWDFANPFLIGFDCSRPADAETRNTVDFLPENNLYRHPDRWGRPVRFERHHDLYSLGLVLMEIGCWRTLPDMDGKKKGFGYIQNPETLRDFFLDQILAKLAHAAGTRYAESVRVCLDRVNWTSYEDWKVQKTVRERILEPLIHCPWEFG